jgi:hypothetical protein
MPGEHEHTGGPMDNNAAPDLNNFWNLREGLQYLRLAFIADEPVKKLRGDPAL